MAEPVLRSEGFQGWHLRTACGGLWAAWLGRPVVWPWGAAAPSWEQPCFTGLASPASLIFIDPKSSISPIAELGNFFYIS